ncbi:MULTISPECIES: PadR family transcriptional regulator [Thermococcus]|nr:MULTISPECIES: PadR family transcriptional regulator [Thermococcus]KUK17357.1 MAG: Transcription regulator, PadR-like family [Thermococcus sibiricus]KUK28578.1 MAG: Transcription regulator, PadR-like family [Thermococcus sp. 40_45]MBC7095201.1 PadR family transcriptional regulator [Thermococcus sp.]HII66819.1 PadR family transcriptional regulator [Thermococcaceae archaeon]
MERPKYKGHLKLLILYLLKEKPQHGYGIMYELETRYGIPTPSPGAIYPILSGLKRNGLIRVAGKGKREKKLYQITDRGKEYLDEHKNELFEVIRMIESFKEFRSLGGNELKEAIKEVFMAIPSLTEEQKKALSDEIEEFTRKIRLIILGGK